MQNPYPNSNPSLSDADRSGGFRRGELLVTVAGNGTGKSRLTDHVIDLDKPRPAGMKTRLTYDLMVESGIRPQYVSLEMRETELVRRMKAALNQGSEPTGQGEDTPIETKRCKP